MVFRPIRGCSGRGCGAGFGCTKRRFGSIVAILGGWLDLGLAGLGFRRGPWRLQLPFDHDAGFADVHWGDAVSLPEHGDVPIAAIVDELLEGGTEGWVLH